MKRLNNNSTSLLFIISLFVGIASCVSTDDVKTTIPDPIDNPTTNPLSSLSPSSSFNWEMYNKQNATISVADRYDNQFDYVLQIFDEKPITGISPIGVGTARGNSPLVISLDINQRSTLLYVRQIDPAGRVETFSFEKPVSDSFTLSLYSTESEAPETRSVASDAVALFTSPAKPENLVSATTFPASASEDFPNAEWSYSGDYVIKEGETKTFSDIYTIGANSSATIYVAGTLEYGNLLTLNNTTIYVLPTGHIQGENLVISNNCNLYIAEGATADMHNVSVYNNAQLVVDGTLEAFNLIGASYSGIFYVAASGVVNVKDDVKDHFSYIYLDANQTNGTGATLNCNNVTIDNGNTKFVVNKLAQLRVSNTIRSRSSLYNEGLVLTKDYNGSEGAIYNSCTVIVTNKLVGLSSLYMINASLSGSWDEEHEILTPIPLAQLEGSRVYLYDGSYVYIDHLNQDRFNVQGYITSTDKEASLIRVNKGHMESYVASSLNGAVKLWIPAKYQASYRITGGASTFINATDLPYDVETCSGLVVKSITGNPKEITIINGGLKGHYTINFEDKWPQFADYDLNDLVYHVGKVQTIQTTDGIINELTVNMQLLAVGATYHLGLGLQFSSLRGSDIQDLTVSSLGQVGAKPDDIGAMDLDGTKQIEGAGATDPVVIPLFYDAHAFLTGMVPSNNNPRTMLGTGGSMITPHDITLHIVFAAGAQINASKLSLSDFDFFLYRPSDKYAADGRVEVHLKDYLPTKNASHAYFGTSNDASVVANSKTYISSNNFPWAIRVMDNTVENVVDDEVTAVHVPWSWVSEGKSIVVAYPKFANWVNSGSDSETAWSTSK